MPPPAPTNTFAGAVVALDASTNMFVGAGDAATRPTNRAPINI